MAPLPPWAWLLPGLLLGPAAALELRAKPRRWHQKLTNVHDVHYYGSSRLANQTLNTVIDTGSVNLVVISDMCKSFCGSAEHLYHVEKHHRSANSATLSYGSGDLSAEQQVQDFHLGPYSAKKQTFWQVVDAAMPLLMDSKFAVIMGLAPQDVSVKANKKNLLQNLGVTSFSICLNRRPHYPGFIMWNDDAHRQFPNVFSEVRLYPSRYWLAELRQVKLGNSLIGCKNGCGAILDSGTSLLSMPPSSFDRLEHVIRQLQPDCNRLQAMPSLHFELGGQKISLPADSYIGILEAPLEANKKQPARRPMGNRTGCAHSFMHVDIQSSLGDTWILGMPFFRVFYTVFVHGPHPSVFLARAGSGCRPDTQTSTALLGTEPRSVRRKARRINTDHVSLPLWVQDALVDKRLPDLNQSDVRPEHRPAAGRSGSGRHAPAANRS